MGRFLHLPLPWALAVLALVARPATAPAQEKNAERGAQVDWVGDWEEAFRQAREGDRPVMLCINSKDGEGANERAAGEIYRDAAFTALSRKFVMMVISTRQHRLTGGVCPRFGKVTCEEHLGCWKALRSRHGDVFFVAGSNGDMISPQHAWFRTDGTLIRRKEYELTKEELLKRMRAVLAEADQPLPKGDAGIPAADAPLSERDRAELERVSGSDDREERRAAAGNLLATGKVAAAEALVTLMRETRKKPLRCDILRALGRARTLSARSYVEDALGDKEPLVRSFAAVALEQLGQPESVDPLLKRVRKERDTDARRNMVLALGVCGGGAADKEAAKQLLKGLHSDKQNEVRKYCALAMRGYEGKGASLVLKKLEQAALKVKDRNVRGAIVYTLAFIGNPRTTAPVLEKVLAKQRDDLGRIFVQVAIDKVKGGDGNFGPASRWLYRETRNDPARSN